MKKILFTILLLLIALPVSAASTLWEHFDYNLPSLIERTPLAEECGIYDYKGSYEQNIAFLACLESQSPEEVNFGSTLPAALSTYNLAGAGVNSSASSITLQSLTLPQNDYEIQDSDMSDIFYITLEPGSRTRQEIVSCTTVTQNAGGTATLSGCTRGLSPITPYTASSSLQFSHAGGTQVIFSDPPQLFNLYPAKDNDETITGDWSYSIIPSSTDECTETDEFCTKTYIDNSVNQGAATSTEDTAGISELATRVENASSTSWGTTEPHVQQSQHATSTPSSNIANIGDGLWDVWSENDGKLNQDWIDLSEDTAWTGTVTIDDREISSSTALTKFGGDGSDGSLDTTSATTTIDASSENIVIKNYTSINISSLYGLTLSNKASDGTILILKSQGNCTISGLINLKGFGADNAVSGYSILDDSSHDGGDGGDAGGSPGVAGTAGTIYANKFFYITSDANRMYRKFINVAVGSGGGNGGDGQDSNSATGGLGGDGGNGGGSLIIECRGALNFESGAVINVSGGDGSDAPALPQADIDAGGGGGGGGASGMVVILYNSLISNSGSIVAIGGDSGAGRAGGTSDNANMRGGGGGAGGGCYTNAGTAGSAGGEDNTAGTAGNAGTLCGGAGGGGGGGGDGAGGAGASGGNTDPNHYLVTENTEF